MALARANSRHVVSLVGRARDCRRDAAFAPVVSAIVNAATVTVVTGLICRVVQDHHGLVTLFVGGGADHHGASSIGQTLVAVHPQLVVEVHHDEQSSYPYLIGIK